MCSTESCNQVLAVFDSVTDDEWARPTLLVPWDTGQPH
jgi:hypothetical protein